MLWTIGQFCLSSPCTHTGTTLCLDYGICFAFSLVLNGERFGCRQAAFTKTIPPYVRHALCHLSTDGGSVEEAFIYLESETEVSSCIDFNNVTILNNNDLNCNCNKIVTHNLYSEYATLVCIPLLPNTDTSTIQSSVIQSEPFKYVP